MSKWLIGLRAAYAKYSCMTRWNSFYFIFFRGCIQICYADTLDTHTVILKWSALPFWCCRQFVGQMKLIRQLNIRYQHWVRWEEKRSQIKWTLPFPWENRNQRNKMNCAKYLISALFHSTSWYFGKVCDI